MGNIPKDFDLLPPWDDRLFKLIMTHPDADPMRLSLVPAIIERPVTSAVVRHPEVPISDTQEKMESFDLNCVADDGSQLDVEMQAYPMKELAGGNHQNLRARSIYNLADLHSSQSSKGVSDYSDLARSYQIMICNFTVFPHRQKFVNPFSMRHDEDGELLHNAIQAIFVELSKLDEILKKPVEQMTDLECWSIFLKYADNPRYRDIVNQIIDRMEALSMAAKLLMNVSRDEKERAIFRSRRKYQMDLESNMATATKIGRIEGRTEGKAEVAMNMMQANMPIDDIIKLTGLNRKEIEGLRM
jgi:predicted transposase/invertase (TIGR01784 family)